MWAGPQPCFDGEATCANFLCETSAIKVLKPRHEYTHSNDRHKEMSTRGAPPPSVLA